MVVQFIESFLELLESKSSALRYQFLEEAFQNQKGIIETSMAKLQEKKNYVHYSVSQVQSRCVLPFDTLLYFSAHVMGATNAVIIVIGDKLIYYVFCYPG